MPTYTNGVLRSRPRVNVPRGYHGNEPQSITKSAPVKDGVTIYSGQAIELKSDKWELADDSSPMASVYIAYHDSEDTDVTSCGKLLGFSVLGEFEIESAWYKQDDEDVKEGAALKINASGELASTGGPTIGYVTEVRDLSVSGHTSANARGGVVGTIPEDSTATNLNIVKFVTSGA